MSKFSRRDFLTSSALGFGALSGVASLTGCHDNDDDNNPFTPPTPVAVSFEHGVASGDPLADRLIIWTRVTPEKTNISLEVTWQVSETSTFAAIKKTDKVMTSDSSDFTVKVDVSGLDANKSYYYRFICNGTTSPAGRAKTLPVGGVSQVKLAVCSCSNYPAGYFHVYAEMAKHNDLDAFLHLGDYTYEYGMGGYATEDAVALGRALPADNSTETIKLDDYRKRYALYRTDKNLQALHANTAMIAVWDDHELSNDAWMDGAENHNEGEGTFSARKTAALKAYFEWMPIRPASPNDYLTIYRQFNFGNLVNLMMLDTRIIARSKQLEYAGYISPTTGAFDAVKFQTELLDADRTLLGATQLTWLQNAIATSTATWNVLGQQILMSKMLIPAELILLLADPAANQAAIFQKINELLTIKGRIANGLPVTDAEKARLYTTVPYNLDAWDGYPIEREKVYGAALKFNKKLVVLAGDTHNAWYSQLHNAASEQIPQVMQPGVEFAVSSVGSPGLEEYLNLPAEQIPATEQAFTSLIEELQYANLNQRGYLLVTFNQTTVSADWRFVDTIKSKTYVVVEARNHNVTLNTSLQSASDIATAV